MKCDFTDSQKAIMLSAIERFGNKLQINKAIEEFCELYVSLKDKNLLFFENQSHVEKSEITTEIADFIIMNWQICQIDEQSESLSIAFIMYGFAMPYVKDYYDANKHKVESEINFKLLRLKYRIENDK